MRSFFYLALSGLAALAAAQGSDNSFKIPSGGYSFEAGQPTELTWRPTTDGTVTLKLQKDGEITPESGITIAANIDNSGSFSFTPSADLPSGSDYTIQIIDDSDPTNYNFTPRFTIEGTTATDTELPSTMPSATMVSSSTSDATTSESSSATETSSSEMSSSTPASTTMPSSTTMMTSSMVSSTMSSSTTSSETSSETSDSTSATETATSVPSPGAAGALTVPGGLVSAALALLALV